MATVSAPSTDRFSGTIGDLLQELGGVPPRRVRMSPTPGTATEKDLLDAETKADRLCELVDGVLVEKVMGRYESAVASALIYFLRDYLRHHRLGVLFGESGFVRTVTSRIRAPDISFVSRERVQARRLPRERIGVTVPDLAVEVLSRGNTRKEMDNKLREYFAAGTRLVWYIDPAKRTARIYTAPGSVETIGEDGVLSGGDVLPGFKLRLRDLFDEAEETGAE